MLELLVVLRRVVFLVLKLALDLLEQTLVGKDLFEDNGIVDCG
jgi:hypothetical protein